MLDRRRPPDRGRAPDVPAAAGRRPDPWDLLLDDSCGPDVFYGPAHRCDAESHVRHLLGEGRTVMIQPYLPAAEDPGEISLVFIAGGFSHAFRKGPVLKAGAGVAERERMIFLGLAEPAAAELAIAGQVHARLERRFGRLAYARVDLVGYPFGQPLVIEVELIDPYLSLSVTPTAVDRPASALQQHDAGSPRASHR